MDNRNELAKQREAISILEAKLANLNIRIARLEVGRQSCEFERRRLRNLTNLSLFLSLGATAVALALFANFVPLLLGLEQEEFTSLGTIVGYLGALAALAAFAFYSNLTRVTTRWYQIRADISEGQIAVAEAERLLAPYGRHSEGSP